MPNQPRKDNPTRQMRVPDDEWFPALESTHAAGTNNTKITREALGWHVEGGEALWDLLRRTVTRYRKRQETSDE